MEPVHSRWGPCRADRVPLRGSDLTRAAAAVVAETTTLGRWSRLATLASHDLDLARLVEAHVDAVTIRTELAADPPLAAQRWAVWAAEPPDGVVRAEPCADGPWRLRGTKRWCSGSHLCTHALITAHSPDGRRIFSVDLAQDGVRADGGGWAGLGMARSGTESVELADAVAAPVGGPGAYLERAGFWHGAIGVAACWYGGAVGIAGPLWTAAGAGRLDGHGLAHLGAVDAALAGARVALRAAAADIDADEPSLATITGARQRALQVRAVVEAAIDTTLPRVGRALGPGPLANDATHSQRVADLGVYLRQSHAERDLAALGELSRPEQAELG